MADTNMRIVIDGDSSGAVTAVKQVSGAMDGLAVGAKGATSGLNTSGVSADNVGRTFTKSGKVFKSTGKLLKSSGLDAASAGASFLSTVPALSGMSSAAGGLVLGLESLSQVVGSLGPVGFGVLAGAAVAGGAAYAILRDHVGAAESAIRTMTAANNATAAAHRSAAKAAWEQGGAELSLKSAILGEKEAALRLSQAHGDVKRALKENGRGSMEYKQAILDERRAELDLVSAKRQRVEAGREISKQSQASRQALRDEVAAAEKAVKATSANNLAQRLGVLQGKDAEKAANAHAEALKRLKTAQTALAAATTASSETVGDLNSQMAALKSRALKIDVDTNDALFAVIRLVGQMALVASKTITLTVKTKHVRGSWNDQETIENLRKEPKKRSFEISFKSGGTGLVESSLRAVSALQGQLNRINAQRAAQDRALAVSEAQAALVEAKKRGDGIATAERALARARQDIVVAGIEKRLAIAERGLARETRLLDKMKEKLEKARDAIASLSGSIGSAIGEALDAKATQDISALDNSPAAVRLRTIEANQRKEQIASERAALDKALADAETPEEKLAAQKELDKWLLEQERQTLEDGLALQKKTIADESAARGAAANRNIADLQDALSRGLISQKDFNTALKGILTASGVDYLDIGSLLGSSFARGFRDQVAQILSLVGKLPDPAPAKAKGISLGAGPDMPGVKKKTTSPIKLPSHATGIDYVPRTGPALIHSGEAVLNRQDAAAYRAGGMQPVVNVTLSGGLEQLAQFVQVQVNQMAEGARRRGLAAGTVR